MRFWLQRSWRYTNLASVESFHLPSGRGLFQERKYDGGSVPFETRFAGVNICGKSVAWPQECGR